MKRFVVPLARGKGETLSPIESARFPSLRITRCVTAANLPPFTTALLPPRGKRIL